MKNVINDLKKDNTRSSYSAGSNIYKNDLINFIINKESESGTKSEEIRSSSSSQSKDNLFLPSAFTEIVRKQQALSEKKAYDKAVKEQVDELIQILRYSSIQVNDEISYAESKIIDIVSNNSFRFLGEVIQTIVLECNDYPKVLVEICRSLERFDYDEVNPWGPSMLIGLLGHKNDLVKEASISLVENWANINFLPALRNIECKTDWMQDYINRVVKYLEDYDVLHKKTI